MGGRAEVWEGRGVWEGGERCGREGRTEVMEGGRQEGRCKEERGREGGRKRREGRREGGLYMLTGF